ncbi:MAG: AmmeMemoRadiSam system protein B [Bdellovibrionales bacterium]|nr:AmmeMemoRadiSam system protein B [Bdellovibrionales bacterium]
MSFALDDKPILRWPLDVQRTSYDGQEVVILNDSNQISPSPAVLPAALIPIVSRFDGEHSVRDIVEEGAPYGVTAELVFELLHQLDRMLFLDTAASRSRIAKMHQEFDGLRVREMAHSGAVYPSERKQLEQAIEDYLSKSSRSWNLPKSNRPLIAMISPHIDYRRGWNTYTAAFDVMSSAPRPDVIFLIGTSHQPGQSIFHLTKKSFECPYGVFPTDTEVVEALSADYGKERSFRNEFLHKREHSLELQLPFIGHRFAQDGLPSLVPILVGSFHHCVEADKMPIEEAEIEDFVAALAAQVKKLRAQGKRVLLYGGVDLAHVGVHFGDSQRVSDGKLGEIESRDRELISHILSADEAKLFHHIAEDNDARRICGFPSMYTMFAALRRCGIASDGTCLEYRQAVDNVSDCIVTFATAAWSEN